MEALGRVGLKMETPDARMRGEKEIQVNRGWCNLSWLFPRELC